MQYLKETLRIIPDFPKPGINFCDITSWLADPRAMHELEAQMEPKVPYGIDKIIAIDARGFIVGTMLARKLNKPLFLARKPGKLPVPVDSQDYTLEYGTATICLEKNVIKPNDNILIVDDLLATGGTIGAVTDIAKKYNPQNIYAFVWIELSSYALQGRSFLESKGVDVRSLLTIYE